ncbi:hypothetical protein I3760_11G061800 [Carya illinoinensis]|nr:hypothetical protein I3760_11G061800 [Carya illinoinensis]
MIKTTSLQFIKSLIMYHLSLLAYYIFFNSTKVVYFLLLLFVGSFYMLIFLEGMRSFQEDQAGRVCEQIRGRRIMQFHESRVPTRYEYSNASYSMIWVSSVADFLKIR